MDRLTLLIAFLVAASPGTASSAESFSFEELASCDETHDPYGQDRLTVERADTHLLVSGLVGLSCGERVTRPQLLPDWGSLTLAIDTDSGGEPVAACRCSAKIRFTLNQEVPSGRIIYLVKNGKGAAHAVAP